MTDIKLSTEQLQQIQQAMDEGGDITLSFSSPEPEQWEPEEGEYVIFGNGTIEKLANINVGYYNLAGNERLTREQAELDAKAKRIFDRMLAYRAEFAPMYDPENNKRGYVYQDINDQWFANQHLSINNPTIVYMPKQIAKDLAVKLNAGTVVF